MVGRLDDYFAIENNCPGFGFRYDWRPMRVQKHHLRNVFFILLCSTVSALISCSSLAEAGRTEKRERILLDSNWSFHAGDVSSNDQNQVISPSYDDRKWKRIDVPHD